ncbi:glycosyltransferase family 25 protein [Avibacterium paragallinarum]|uniref:glycosyltransferase family 25 protein n=1 Tax=Avibacterium paragallinarum TaxID=728 RepID=UPI00398840E1
MKNIQYKGFVLSLQKDELRRKNFYQQVSSLDSNHIQFETFYAIDAKKDEDKAYIDEHFDFAKAKKLYGHDVSYGEAACSLSHIKIYEQAISQQSYLIVCEDDAKFNKDFPKLERILKQSDFDIIIFGESKAPSFKGSRKYRLAYPLQFKPYRFGNYKLGCIYGFYTPGTVGYAINVNALKYIIQLVQKTKVYWLADDFQEIINQVNDEYNYKISIAHLFPRLVIEDLSIQSHLETERVQLQKQIANNNLSLFAYLKHNISLLKAYLKKRHIAYNDARKTK